MVTLTGPLPSRREKVAPIPSLEGLARASKYLVWNQSFVPLALGHNLISIVFYENSDSNFKEFYDHIPYIVSLIQLHSLCRIAAAGGHVHCDGRFSSLIGCILMLWSPPCTSGFHCRPIAERYCCDVCSRRYSRQVKQSPRHRCCATTELKMD